MMRYTDAAALLLAAVASSCVPQAADPFTPDTIVALERAALERWGKGDPDGFLAIMAPDITYFDPTTAARIDGHEALKAYLEQVRGRLSIDRAEMLNPRVDRIGDTAVLTFNLISHGGSFNNSPKRDVKWNSTEVYGQIDGTWKIVHSHWSNTTPAGAQP